MSRIDIMVKFVLFVTFLFGASLAVDQLGPVVQTNSGPVRGLVESLPNGRLVHFFQGIRFGVVKRRFGKPVEVEKWTEIYNATHFRYACPQPGKRLAKPGELPSPGLGETNLMSEDCLFLNVFQPIPSNSSTKSPDHLPVMVWIHGGGLAFGTIFSSNFNSKYIASIGDVVVVTLNYRLGPFGFLYTGTEEAPGNMGFHDQILGLKWVRDNIGHFGGDPKRVTIFGESAGAKSVGALVLSPLAKGLFHRAILQSGSPNSILGSSPAKLSLHKAHVLAKKFHCDTNNNLTHLVHCLRNQSVESLSKDSGFNVANHDIMSPVYGDSLLPNNPVRMLKTGEFNHVDLLYGVTRDEGSSFVTSFIHDLSPAKTKAVTLDKVKQWIRKIIEVTQNEPGEDILEFYLKKIHQNSTQQEMRNVVFEAFGDFYDVCPTILFGESMANLTRAQGHYFYSYRFEEKMKQGGCAQWMGICHASDVPFLFGTPIARFGTPKYNFEEDYFSRTIIRVWTNFAKFGHPGKMGSVDWKMASTEKNPDTNHMVLRDEHFRMVPEFFLKNCNFWKPKIFA